MASKLKVTVVSGKSLIAKNKGKTSSPYCEVTVFDDQGVKVGSPICTSVKKNNLQPSWNETLSFALSKAPKETFTLNVRVWDKHTFRKDKFMGKVEVHFNAALVQSTGIVEGWFDLQARKKTERVSGQINLKVQYGSLKASTGSPVSGGSAEKEEDIPRPPVGAVLSGAAQDPELKRSLVSSGNHFIVVTEDVTDEFDRQREGPATTGLVKLPRSQVTLRDKNCHVENTSGALEGVMGDVKVNGGKWYFEIQLKSYGQMQIGWCTSDFDPKKDKGDSWGFDGNNQQKLRKKTSVGRYGEYWSNGDIIGCALDLEDRTLAFYKNGKNMGLAFGGTDLPKRTKLSPYANLSRGMKATFNFGASPFKHTVAGFNGLHCFLDEGEIMHLAGLFEHYKAIRDEDDIEDDIILDLGIEQFNKDLGIVNDDDPAFFIIAWKLNCETAWEITRDEWMNGWTVSACSTVKEMGNKIKEWKQSIDSNKEQFREWYEWLFDYLKGDKRIMDWDTAKVMWEILLKPKGWAFFDRWIEWNNDTKKTQAINKDVWYQLLFVMNTYPSSFDAWDEGESALPLLLDDFIIFITEG